MTIAKGLGPVLMAVALGGAPALTVAQGQAAERAQGRGQSQAGERGQGGPGQARAAERAQGRPGQGQSGRGQERDPAQARAQGRAEGGVPGAGSAAGRSRAGVAPGQLRRGLDELPDEVRRLATGDRPAGRMAAGAAARARLRGAEGADVDVRVDAERVRILNRRGETLVDLDDDRARRLGAWDVRLLGDERPRPNAPAFCESGAGHPVWGRQWCLDKGFGLGSDDDYLWGRSDVDDVVFRRRADADVLDRGTLIDVLGDVVLGRLALHALTLGFTEPLVGAWTAGAEPDAPRILMVRSGNAPVAELVDRDRDDEVDVLFVVSPRW